APRFPLDDAAAPIPAPISPPITAPPTALSALGSPSPPDWLVQPLMPPRPPAPRAATNTTTVIRRPVIFFPLDIMTSQSPNRVRIFKPKTPTDSSASAPPTSRYPRRPA